MEKRNRKSPIQIRLTEKEKAIIEQSARGKGLSLSSLIRLWINTELKEEGRK